MLDTMLSPREKLAPSDLIELEERFAAHNYHPLDVVLARGEGVYVWDVQGKCYLDCLAAYSAVNQGHVHPTILAALVEQASKLTISSRAFRNDQFGLFAQELCALTGRTAMLPMNTGAEAVETAIKLARKWAVKIKGVPQDAAEIIVCAHNFHGRTTTIVGFSSDPDSRQDFGPFAPGFKVIPFGDAQALEDAITPNTAAFLVEPIQGEAGVIIPPEGYLRAVRDICTRHDVLMMLDEVQTGLGRTGKLLAEQHENVQADITILGKALGGGFYPVSAVVSSRAVMDVIKPGEHGSTFGGNPLACAVARAAMQVLTDEDLAGNAERIGAVLIDALKGIRNDKIKQVRGRGLMIAVELHQDARPVCERLQELGVLCKETHGTIVRISPPLVITEAQALWVAEQVEKALR